MGKVEQAKIAGSIIRRVREEKGISRAELSESTGVGVRSLYALEQGEAENFGIGRFLKLLNALGLSMSVDASDTASLQKTSANAKPCASPAPAWDDLGDMWKLEDARNE